MHSPDHYSEIEPSDSSGIWTLSSDGDHLASAEPLTPAQVVAKIEAFTLTFVEALVNEHRLVPIEMITRRSSNTVHFMDQVRVGDAKHKRTFEANPTGYSNIWRVLEFIHELLLSGKKATQRDVYYILKSTFDDQPQLNRLLQDVVAFLNCPRRCLGIIASPRGTMAGLLRVRIENGPWIDCSKVGRHGHLIPGDEEAITELQCEARYLVVVEKDGVFARLVEDRLFRQIPCVIVTAKGFPDLATRALISRLRHQFDLIVVGLCDWNPGGLAVLAAYRQGSIGMALEAFRYAVDMKWLGLRSGDIDALGLAAAEVHLQPQTEHDRRKLDELARLPWIANDAKYMAEVQEMRKRGTKMELQAIFSLGFEVMSKFVAMKLLRKEWI